MPRPPKWAKVSLLVALLVGSHHLSAAPRVFPDHNFSIQLPEGWAVVEPPPEKILLCLQSWDRTGKLYVAAQERPANEDSLAIGAFGYGVKASMTQLGWWFDPDQQVTVGDRAFSLLLGHHASPNASNVTYITGAGHEVYAISFTGTRGITPGDRTIASTVRSFRLLAPAPPMPINPFSPPAGFLPAYQFGALMGRAVAYCLIGIIFLLLWQTFRWLFSRN